MAMTKDEEKLINLLKNGSSEFKQKASGIFKNLYGGEEGFSTSRIITGGVSETDRDFNRLLATRKMMLTELGEASIQAGKGFALLEEESKKLFGTTEKAAEAQRALSREMRTFAFMSADVQKELGTATMVLDQFGVSMSTTGEILDSAAMAFGMSQSELSGLATTLAEVVYKFPGQASDIARNFQSAQSSLAYDSKKLMQVFKGLQNVSSTTGVSFSTLTSKFGETMDTFEGSANKAGSLNAILGRSVFNSIDLLGKTEAERVDTIVKGVRSSIGGDVNRLGKFQLKAVAEGLGLTPEETRRLLSGQSTVDEVVKGKESADPKIKLQQQANSAMGENTMTIEALTTEFKSFRSPLVNMTRKLEEITRRTLLDEMSEFIRKNANVAPDFGVRSMAEGAEILANMMIGITPDTTLNDPQKAQLMRTQGKGAEVLEVDKLDGVRLEAFNFLVGKGISNVEKLKERFGITVPEPDGGGKTDPNTGGTTGNTGSKTGDKSKNEDASPNTGSSLVDKISKSVANALGMGDGQPMKIEITGLDGGTLKGLLKTVKEGPP